MTTRRDAAGTGVRWGVTLPLAGRGLHQHREIVEALPSLGYGHVWTGEGGGYDGLTALTAASMAELGQAEVLLGIGSSVPAHVTALNGRPYAHVRDLLRSALPRVPRLARPGRGAGRITGGLGRGGPAGSGRGAA
ncbi:hypothetical protein ACQP2K_19725 [Microbispora siamensis]